jgi:hypothetical protein
MSKDIKTIDTEALAPLNVCSLYQAANWIAFNEKPIDEKIAELVYPERNDVLFHNRNTPMYQFYESKVEWQTAEEREDYNRASKLLLAQLILGNIGAQGFPLSGTKEEESPPTERISLAYKEGYAPFSNEKTTIPKDFWAEIYLKFDSIVSEAGIVPAPLAFNNECTAYCNITINCKQLLKAFPDTKKPPYIETRGRKTKYDWTRFLIQIILIAQTPDGLPEKQAELEESMSLWCDNNWGKTPSESMIREKISPIYQELKKADN